MSLYNQKTLTQDVSFYSSQEHTDKHTRAHNSLASVPLLSDSKTGHSTFSAVSRAGLAWLRVCECVCGCKASLIFHKRDGLEFPLQRRSHKLSCSTHTHTCSLPPLPAPIITTSCKQSPERSLASFFILFAFSLSIFHPSLAFLSVPLVSFISISVS